MPTMHDLVSWIKHFVVTLTGQTAGDNRLKIGMQLQ